MTDEVSLRRIEFGGSVPRDGRDIRDVTARRNHTLENLPLIAGFFRSILTRCAMAQGGMPAGMADTSEGKALVDTDA